MMMNVSMLNRSAFRAFLPNLPAQKPSWKLSTDWSRIMQKLNSFFRSKMASASALLMISMTVVNAGNYIYNLIMGRWLGPSLFSDLSLIVTMLLIVTFLTAPIQMTTSRYSAIHTADGDEQKLASIRRFIW